MFNKIIKEKADRIVMIIALSLGASIFIPFFNAFCLSLAAILIYEMLQKKEIGDDIEKMLQSADEYMVEQEEVIKNYENIFDSMVTTLPCNCGGNMFEGLFQPGVENLVECEKCHSKYKVMVSFDSILISDPIDLDQANLEINKKFKEHD
jgi:hypothetical protein